MTTSQAPREAVAGPETASLEEPYAIELVGITKSYAAVTALSDISLEIEPGELVVLLGPSGCGKSTILKIIAGLEDPTEGEVYINGRLANYVRPGDRDVAMVFQNYALYPNMTVADNIGFPLKMRKAPKGEIAHRVGEVAGMLELSEQLKRLPEQLSGGQRQRVALGRAIIRRPVAFLMDEPLSNLDALLRVQMRSELLKLHRQVGRTTVYVTHDQVEAMTMADRIVVLRAGRIQQVGTTAEIYARPANTFVATFVGSPQMNLFPGTLEDTDVDRHVAAGVVVPLGAAWREVPTGSNVTIGVRPEDVVIAPGTEAGAIAGMVDLLEDVGAESFVTVAIEGATCMVRTNQRTGIAEGGAVSVRFPPAALHLFDSTGERIAEADR